MHINNKYVKWCLNSNRKGFVQLRRCCKCVGLGYFVYCQLLTITRNGDIKVRKTTFFVYTSHRIKQNKQRIVFGNLYAKDEIIKIKPRLHTLKMQNVFQMQQISYGLPNSHDIIKYFEDHNYDIIIHKYGPLTCIVYF